MLRVAAASLYDIRSIIKEKRGIQKVFRRYKLMRPRIGLGVRSHDYLI
jgi:hypothetical protein